MAPNPPQELEGETQSGPNFQYLKDNKYFEEKLQNRVGHKKIDLFKKNMYMLSNIPNMLEKLISEEIFVQKPVLHMPPAYQTMEK